MRSTTSGPPATATAVPSSMPRTSGRRGARCDGGAIVAGFAAFGLALVTFGATAGCRRNPGLDLRPGSDAGLAAAMAPVGESVTLTSSDARLAATTAAKEASESREPRRSALDAHWSAWRGTKVIVPPCRGNAIAVLQDQAHCAAACDSDRSCRAGDTCELAFHVPEDGVIPAELADLTTVAVCTSRPATAATLPRNLSGAPRLVSGACAQGYTSLPIAGSLCYRSCDGDSDCPGGSSCSKVKGAKVCAATAR